MRVTIIVILIIKHFNLEISKKLKLQQHMMEKYLKINNKIYKGILFYYRINKINNIIKFRIKISIHNNNFKNKIQNQICKIMKYKTKWIKINIKNKT